MGACPVNTVEEVSYENGLEYIFRGVLKSSSMYSDLRSEGREDKGRDLIFLPRSALPKDNIVQWLRPQALKLDIKDPKSTYY